jgi:hypothetical protein
VPQLSFAPLSREDATTAIAALTAAANQQQVPSGFVDLLVAEVGSRLGLPADRVVKAIAERQAEAPPTPAGQLGAAAQAVAPMVQQATQ